MRDDPKFLFFFLFVVRPGFEWRDILSVSMTSSSFASSRGQRQEEQDDKRAIVMGVQSEFQISVLNNIFSVKISGIL